MPLFYADADWSMQDFADGTPIDLADEDTHPLIVRAMDFGRADHLVKLVRPPVLKHVWSLLLVLRNSTPAGQARLPTTQSSGT
jgi:hypothetical protein